MNDAIAETQEPPLPDLHLCKNCAAPVAGFDYCPACGQKSDTHVLTFRELLEELADGLLNLDSRLWRSLLPLALVPGKLTNEYLRGRRMYYLPPFRLYLILSVLFFLLPADSTSIQELPGNIFAPDGDNGQASVATTGGQANGDTDFNGGELTRQIRDEINNELEQARVEDRGPVLAGNQCEFNGFPPGSMITLALKKSCRSFVADPQAWLQGLAENIPVMMILGMPLVALFMHMVYSLSGRYYVEHIIFLFHTHAFFFLASIAMAMSSLLGQRYPVLFSAMDWFRIVTGWYILAYIFLAMLRVYGDSKWKTFFKACFVMMGYGTSILVVGLLGVLVTALRG